MRLTIRLAILVLLAPLLVQPVATAAQTPSDDAVRDAVAALEAGDSVRAIGILERLQQEFPLSTRAMAMLGTLYRGVGRDDDALSLLEPLSERQDADPAVLFNLAELYLERGDEARAEALLERSIARSPVSPAARTLGMRRGSQGRYRDAYRLLRPWAMARQGDTEARIAAVYAALKIRRTEEAAEMLATLPEGNREVALLNARLQLQQGNPQGTIDTIRALGARHPEIMDLDVRSLLAEALLRGGQPALAAEMLRGQPVENAGTALLLSQALFSQGDARGASAALAPFVEPLLASTYLPDDPLTRELHAGLSLEQGRYMSAQGEHERAVTLLEYATVLLPDFTPAWSLLAGSLEALGRQNEAILARERFQALVAATAPDASAGAPATGADPAGSAISSATQQAAGGDLETALTSIRSAIERHPDDPRLLLMQTHLLLNLGRAEEAVAATERTLEVAPDLPDALYQNGLVHLLVNDRPAAEQAFRRTLERAPDHVAALNDLALLLMTEGNNREARTLLERALVVNPQDQIAKQRLERLASN